MWSVAVAAILSLISTNGAEVPDAFLDRTALPSCGAILQGLGEAWDRPAASHPQVGCLAEALRTGAAAELVAGYTTVEGGTVVYYYRAEPGRPGLEVFLDASADAFSARPWEHARCPHAAPDDVVANLGGCAWD